MSAGGSYSPPARWWGAATALPRASREWPRAVEVYRSLWTFFPDEIEHGLRLAKAQIATGGGKEARATLAALRRLPPPASEDPRVDLSEALAAESLSDYKGELEMAARAAAKAGERGAWSLVARARLAEAWAHRYLGRPREAAAALSEARRLYEAAGDKGGVALALVGLSGDLENEGDLAGARRAVEESLAIYREIGDDNGTARTSTASPTSSIARGTAPVRGGAARSPWPSSGKWKTATAWPWRPSTSQTSWPKEGTTRERRPPTSWPWRVSVRSAIAWGSRRR